jgi:medium-chain acyl-[acyl-carrier-protein] hydrolase
VSHLGEGDLDGVVRELGTPGAALADPELRAIVLPALRADLIACERYEYGGGSAIACPITALAGRDDPLVSRTGVEAWRERTTGAFDVRWFDGDHLFLNSVRAAVAGVVSAALRESCSPG